MRVSGGLLAKLRQAIDDLLGWRRGIAVFGVPGGKPARGEKELVGGGVIHAIAAGGEVVGKARAFLALGGTGAGVICGTAGGVQVGEIEGVRGLGAEPRLLAFGEERLDAIEFGSDGGLGSLATSGLGAFDGFGVVGVVAAVGSGNRGG